VSFTVEGAVDATVAVLEPVTGIGQVHRQRRTLTDEATITRHLRNEATGELAGAFVSVPRIRAEERHFGNTMQAGVLTTVFIQIEMFAGLVDADGSEAAFRTRVAAALQAINSRGKIYSDPACSHQEPCSADQIAYIALAGVVLAHYAVITFALRGRTSPTA
jgi:hypothetical protein